MSVIEEMRKLRQRPNSQDVSLLALTNEQLSALLAVVDAANEVSRLLQSEVSEGYVDTHTAAALAEALEQLEK